MNKDEKQVIIDGVTEKVRRAKGLYLTDFTGMTVEQMTEFRRELRKSGIDFKVAKNTLIKRSLKEVGGYDKAYEALVGTTGIAFGYDDPVEPARIMKKFIEKNEEKPVLKMAFVEGVAYEGKHLKAIAALPSRNDLIAAILGSLQAPASGIVGSINAVMRDVASLVEEVAKKRAA
ncbi:MAG TPA: 50S ribosomal protein L10 [Candidatus Kapabacteria bacterium]|nr:50S ribosomal protein L10 [Candidatus Kapabacteria bacterium]